MKNIVRIVLLFAALYPAPGLSAQPYTPGQSYFGADNYIEYIAGSLPIILSAPHGGSLQPAGIPDRDCAGCSYLRDTYTEELARAVAARLHARTGCRPHVVINRLHRRKLDMNRDLPEATDSNAVLAPYWNDFHNFIDAARMQVQYAYGKGLYIDLHGHAHTIQRMELGYLLTAGQLQKTDAELNTAFYITRSGMRNLASENAGAATHADLLRGPSAFGSLLAARGYPAVPSDADPFPDVGEPFFDGGYNTGRYSSRNGGTIDGFQIEANGTGVRDNLTNVNRFADSLAVTLIDYLRTHYFTDVADFLCDADGDAVFPPPAEPGAVEIYPNPYCRSFTLHRHAPDGAWTAAIYDFFGNFREVKTLEIDVPVQIAYADHPNVYVVLYRDGVAQEMRPVVYWCR